MKREIITSVDPKSPVSEVFRTLRTNLQYLNKKNGAQTILLTSTIQGEGKSFIAANLAVTFAQANKKVIIVDTDMRRPRQHKLYNVDMYPGLSNYLSGVNINRSSHKTELRECIYKTKIDNLFVLPAGNIPPNPSELLQSEKLAEMIGELKKQYDVVIFDGAPCLLVTDATLVSRLVDATILVVSQRKTRVEELKEAMTRIKRVGGRVVGVVLNRVKISSKKYGDKYYYASSNDGMELVPTKAGRFSSLRAKLLGTNVDNRDEDIVVENKEEKDNFESISTDSYKEEKTIKNTEDNKSEESKKTEENKSKEDKKTEKKKIVVNGESANADKIKEILDEINKVKEDKK